MRCLIIEDDEQAARYISGGLEAAGHAVVSCGNGVDGLYLASTGCHGGPGITFIPGYNAAQAALADLKT